MTRRLKRTWIARCRTCKTHRRIEAGTELARGEFCFSTKSPVVACVCETGRIMNAKPLRGRFSNHKCGARCLASKGPVCECACGGKNHGTAA